MGMGGDMRMLSALLNSHLDSITCTSNTCACLWFSNSPFGILRSTTLTKLNNKAGKQSSLFVHGNHTNTERPQILNVLPFDIFDRVFCGPDQDRGRNEPITSDYFASAACSRTNAFQSSEFQQALIADQWASFATCMVQYLPPAILMSYYLSIAIFCSDPKKEKKEVKTYFGK